jgi:hypothetical protein
MVSTERLEEEWDTLDGPNHDMPGIGMTTSWSQLVLFGLPTPFEVGAAVGTPHTRICW